MTVYEDVLMILSLGYAPQPVQRITRFAPQWQQSFLLSLAPQAYLP